ncbi:MAG TPA: ATP-binding protein [Candidatus Portnoybacteria bacterium]|nr:ATP-binding protein [Candidatus Portnoybacteria bacterium]
MNKKERKLFDLRNPWRKNRGFLVPRKYIEREIEKDLKSNMSSGDILVIYGPRQVGKTTLLHKTIRDLCKKGVSPKDLFYFFADDKLFKNYFREPIDLLEFIMSRKKKKAYLFIDEVQRLPNPGIFLKNLYDYKIKDLKIIVTGSSVLEIRSKIVEYLPGRKKTFMLFPLSFKEILKFGKLTKEEQKKKAWQEYLIFGGYPKVFLAGRDSSKKQELKDIYESYIKKDIVDYLKIEKPEKFNQLVILLADQITGLVNIDEITNTLGINRATVEKYLEVLESTFVVKKVYPFFRNPRTEIIKMPKIYFLDLGLRNMILRNFRDLDKRADTGKLAENFVFNQFEYNKDIETEINFWRTKSGAEIDFVVQTSKGINLYEVKYAKSVKRAETAATNSFGKKYKFNQVFILTGGKVPKNKNCLNFWNMEH